MVSTPDPMKRRTGVHVRMSQAHTSRTPPAVSASDPQALKSSEDVLPPCSVPWYGANEGVLIRDEPVHVYNGAYLPVLRAQAKPCGVLGQTPHKCRHEGGTGWREEEARRGGEVPGRQRG